MLELRCYINRNDRWDDNGERPHDSTDIDKQPVESTIESQEIQHHREEENDAGGERHEKRENYLYLRVGEESLKNHFGNKWINHLQAKYGINSLDETLKNFIATDELV